MTAKEVTAKMKADKCSTQSRSKNGKKYHNKYTEYFGKKGYSGINKNGVFTKHYSYGVVGHCCIAVQYWLCQCGYSKFVPKSPKYLFNTNKYMKWLKGNPKGVKWVTDRKKAKLGAIAFKGSAGKKDATHTCVFLYYKGDYVYTVDFNVSDGKGHNNGTLKKRHKKYFRGFANIPYATETKASEGDKMSNTETKYVKGKNYTLEANMYVRATHSTSGHKLTKKELSANAQKVANDLGVLPKGTKVSCLEVYTSKSSTWLRTPSGWICAKDSKKTYIK